MKIPNLNPLRMLFSIWQHRYLIGQLVRRDVILKYRGSYLGIGWSFLYPLLLLATFTVVFGGVFDGRWARGQNDGMKSLDLALFMYCALVVFNPFSEVATATPRLMLANQNLVKRIIFPTEILPLVTLLSASVHGLTHVFILALISMLAGHAHVTVVVAPIVLLPVWLFTLGVAWLFSVLGVYVRDLAHGMPVIMQLCMFLLPVFYPLTAAPSFLRTLHAFNPIAMAMEDMRRTVIMGLWPDWGAWFLMSVVGLFFAAAGYATFMRCKEEFADVL